MEQANSENRFEKLSKLNKSIFYILFFIMVLVTLELGAFATAFFLKTIGIGKNIFSQYSNNFHPVFNGKPLGQPLKTEADGLSFWNEYDPWYGYRNSYEFKDGIYGTDLSGFISDGNVSRDINFKEDSVFRVFIMGGSTVAGHGASAKNKTISNQLQEYLNLHKPSDIHKTFQVINAGVAGYFSPLELAYLEFEVINYQPDMIIVLNGYNDFSRILRLSKENESNLKRYHWGKYHYYLKNYIDNSSSEFRIPDHLQPQKYFYFVDFFSRLLNRFQGSSPPILDLPKVVKERHPNVTQEDFYKVRRYVERLDLGNWVTEEEINNFETVVNNDAIHHYIDNVIFMKAVCTSKNIHFLSVLQPMLFPQAKRFLTDNEEFYFDLKRQYIAQLYNVNYQQMLYDYSTLASKQLVNHLNNSFLDLTMLFHDIEDALYVDSVHYDDIGNHIISKRLAAFVFSKARK